MMWYRSWPADGELRARRCTRPHVVDRLPRLAMSNFDYLTVTNWPTDPGGFCMLEWDVALDQRSRHQFGRVAKRHGDDVLVAPYQYGTGGWLPDGVTVGDDRAPAFGFGCIYFPQAVLAEALRFFRGQAGRMSDMTFSAWHLERYGPARVTWDIHPQHLREFA